MKNSTLLFPNLNSIKRKLKRNNIKLMRRINKLTNQKDGSSNMLNFNFIKKRNSSTNTNNHTNDNENITLHYQDLSKHSLTSLFSIEIDIIRAFPTYLKHFKDIDLPENKESYLIEVGKLAKKDKHLIQEMRAHVKTKLLEFVSIISEILIKHRTEILNSIKQSPRLNEIIQLHLSKTFVLGLNMLYKDNIFSVNSNPTINVLRFYVDEILLNIPFTLITHVVKYIDEYNSNAKNVNQKLSLTYHSIPTGEIHLKYDIYEFRIKDIILFNRLYNINSFVKLYKSQQNDIKITSSYPFQNIIHLLKDIKSVLTSEYFAHQDLMSDDNNDISQHLQSLKSIAQLILNIRRKLLFDMNYPVNLYTMKDASINSILKFNNDISIMLDDSLSENIQYNLDNNNIDKTPAILIDKTIIQPILRFIE